MGLNILYIMKFFYLSFNQWNKLDKLDKQQYLFLSTAKTTPVYFTGQSFYPFVPSTQLFLAACKNFAESNFEQRYKQQIYSLNKDKILQQLQKFKTEIIIFLIWEAENKQSQRDIFIPWLTNSDISNIHAFSFSTYLKNKKIENMNKTLFEL